MVSVLIQTAGLAIAYFLALVLAMAAVHKFLDIRAFGRVIESYDLLPSSVTTPVAMILPVVELGVALALLFGPIRAMAAAVAAILFVVYGIAIGINVARGRTRLDCGCSFGRTSSGLGGHMLLRNGVLVLLAAFVAFEWADMARSMEGLTALLYVNAVLAAVGLWLFYAAIDVININATHPIHERKRHG